MKNHLLLQETNFNKLKNIVKENSDKQIIFSSNNDELNRKVLEKLKIQILLLNLAGRKDFQKQRNSGFNHVLAKLAKKQEVCIGINLDEIITSSPKQKSEILARVRQNIKLCNKNKVKMCFVSSQKNQRNLHDLKSLGIVLGMHTSLVKKLIMCIPS